MRHSLSAPSCKIELKTFFSLSVLHEVNQEDDFGMSEQSMFSRRASHQVIASEACSPLQLCTDASRKRKERKERGSSASSGS